LTSDHVDPSALMIAVVVVVIGPLLQTGNWSYLSTVVAGVVLVIVVAYSLRPSRQSLSRLQLLAVSLVIGFIVSVAVSWPIQLLVGNPDIATGIGFGLGALAVALCFWWNILEEEQQELWRQRWQKLNPLERGHDSTRAALTYLHSSAQRQRAIADQIGQNAMTALGRKRGQSGTHVARDQTRES